jgi:hypothetical protein
MTCVRASVRGNVTDVFFGVLHVGMDVPHITICDANFTLTSRNL